MPDCSGAPDCAALGRESCDLSGRCGDCLPGRIALTERGRPLVRIVAAAFDRYLAKAQARHSVAV